MTLLLALLFMVGTGSVTLADKEIPPEVIQQEKAAFKLCDNDGSGCLDWPEVEECEEKFSAVLAATGSPVPTEEDFKSSDLNGNGCLTYEEWEEWVQAQ